MATEIDRDRINANWFQGEDPERAVAEVTSFFQAVALGKVDCVQAFDDMEYSAPVLWDGPGGNASLVLNAVRSAKPTWEKHEKSARSLGLDSAEFIDQRSRRTMLEARALHRVGECTKAFLRCHAVLAWLAEQVGGWAVLRDIIGRPGRSAVARAAVGALGLFANALYRAGFSEDLEKEHFDKGFDLVTRYLRMEQGGPVLYPGTHALAAQNYFKAVLHVPDDEVVQAPPRLPSGTSCTRRGSWTRTLRPSFDGTSTPTSGRSVSNATNG